MMVGRLVSFWEGLFSGAMLNFGRVSPLSGVVGPFPNALFVALKGDPVILLTIPGSPSSKYGFYH